MTTNYILSRIKKMGIDDIDKIIEVVKVYDAVHYAIRIKRLFEEKCKELKLNIDLSWNSNLDMYWEESTITAFTIFADRQEFIDEIADFELTD